jgi:hypothetical protein
MFLGNRMAFDYQQRLVFRQPRVRQGITHILRLGNVTRTVG